MISVEIFGAWLSILFTLAILSYLYKDNPFYKASEHIFVGISSAYWAVTFFWTKVHPNLFGRLWPSSQYENTESLINTLWYFPYKIIRGFTTIFGIVDNDVFPKNGIDSGWNDISYSYLIPFMLGIFMLLRLVPSLSWLARWAIAYIVGMAAGLRFYGYLNSDILEQITASTIDLSSSPTDIINSAIIIFGTLSGLLYFFFSRSDTGIISKFSKIGIYFLMISFGASFGFAVMGRVSLLIGRFNSLIEYSSKDYYYGSFWIFGVMIIILAIWAFKFDKSNDNMSA
ncbi:MAG: hypothetical protein CMF96_11525 [Candidatus Marinimicrobia bacterium]|nr:hypothetical protein [Candidatus Neomarinimicrobiota bacterium]